MYVNSLLYTYIIDSSILTISDDDFELPTKSVKKKKFNKVEPGRNPALTIDSG